jgi:hypothetical protein
MRITPILPLGALTSGIGRMRAKRGSVQEENWRPQRVSPQLILVRFLPSCLAA